MAARFKTKEHTLSGSSESLSDIFTSPHDEFVGSITMRLKHSAASDLEWADSDGSAGGFLQPGEGNSWNLDGKWVKLSEIYLTGGAGDIVNITLIG